jgi:hypothetical protein
MARPKELEEEVVQSTVYLTESDSEYLKNNGFPLTKFLRQAINAQRNKEWEFEHNEK